MTYRACRMEGCYLRLNGSADICPKCAIQERRRKRGERRRRSPASGVQSKFDIYSTVVVGTYTTRDSPTVPFGSEED